MKQKGIEFCPIGKLVQHPSSKQSIHVSIFKEDPDLKLSELNIQGFTILLATGTKQGFNKGTLTYRYMYID